MTDFPDPNPFDPPLGRIQRKRRRIDLTADLGLSLAGGMMAGIVALVLAPEWCDGPIVQSLEWAVLGGVPTILAAHFGSAIGRHRRIERAMRRRAELTAGR